MKISTILAPAAVVPRLAATDKTGALRELSRALAGSVDGLEETAVYQALAERESRGSTSIGRGVAIPHAKLDGLSRIYAAFGRSPKGIPFESPDGRPTHLIFLLLAPGNDTNGHLAALDRVSKMMWRDENRRRLLSADDETMFEVLQQMDEEV
jgi:mannitol/fructose-specific phosphotransferase system IIA component (Ntr-type)